MIQFIACDLDGTLLNDQKQISPSSREYIEQLRKKKIHFALASGRSRDAIQGYFGDFPCSMVTDNGARAYTEDGECLFCDEIDPAATVQVIEELDSVDYMHIFLIGEKHTYARKKEPGKDLKQAQYYFSPRIITVDSWEDAFAQDTITKLSINTGWDGRNEEKGWQCITGLGVESHFTPVMSGDGWIELMKAGTTKGNALKRLCASMGIPMEETMVFGDYLNDLNMLLVTPNSYAMINGHEEVKRQCAYVTKYNNNEDGVVRAIEERLHLL